MMTSVAASPAASCLPLDAVAFHQVCLEGLLPVLKVVQAQAPETGIVQHRVGLAGGPGPKGGRGGLVERTMAPSGPGRRRGLQPDT